MGMDPEGATALAEQAVEVARKVTCSEEYEPVWALLRQIAADGVTSLRLGTSLVDSSDPVARATGCDLLGLASGLDEAIREAAAGVLLSLAAAENDTDVQWSIARALGATGDQRAVPVLVALSDHADPDVRFQVAAALPRVWAGDPDGVDILAMIRLTGDPDPEVRNWATFGLGFLIDVDTVAVRAALWARTSDDFDEARAEGVRGLARRHDRRSVTLLAELLDDEGGAHVLTFLAAAVLCAPELLPHLQNYDPKDIGVADALSACDPVARDRRDELAVALLGAVHRQLPGADLGLYADWFEPGLTLDVRIGGETHSWSVESLLERAGGDPERAARLAIADTTSR
jgi:HEAT repeat protein